MAEYILVNGKVMVALVGGQVLENVHDESQCAGEYCTIHNFSDHHMVDWPQNWRSDRGIMERVCVHGVGHPDPDDPKFKHESERVHGCDGCCTLDLTIENVNSKNTIADVIVSDNDRRMRITSKGTPYQITNREVFDQMVQINNFLVDDLEKYQDVLNKLIDINSEYYEKYNQIRKIADNFYNSFTGKFDLMTQAINDYEALISDSRIKKNILKNLESLHHPYAEDAVDYINGIIYLGNALVEAMSSGSDQNWDKAIDDWKDYVESD